ncbi:hypothetical protein [Nocardiopsis sp. FR26]|uniref:hypothetical protein n=1 Tax=Nocardiopsis sp. FR26 TaxID=2605987 RepID=UPI001359B10D|nr:hypothetical protein [Nocardiopsis sp. FR26]
MTTTNLPLADIEAINTLPRQALLDIGEAVDLIGEVTEDIAEGFGDPNDLTAYTNRLHLLCAENNINPAAALYTFA